MIKSRIVNQTAISGDIYKMTLEAEPVTRQCVPGQFMHMLIDESLKPFLRRPFSIHRLDEDGERLDLLYRVIGTGTRMMSTLGPGDCVDLMGPLGNGFNISGKFNHAVIAAGGMGSAPVFFLIDRLLKLGKRITFFWGVRASNEFFDLEWLKNNGVELQTSSEDGRIGHHGLVTELLGPYFESRSTENMAGFVCGPKPMLKTVQTRAEDFGIEWQVSMEEIMACGEGICMGCATPLIKGGYGIVCKDGPVFDLQEIAFHD